MRNAKLLVALFSLIFIFSTANFALADEPQSEANQIQNGGQRITVKNHVGEDSFDLNRLDDGKTHRLHLADGSYRGITGLSDAKNSSTKFFEISDNDTFDLITPLLGNSQLFADGQDISGLIGDDGHAALTLDPNVSHRFEYKSETPVIGSSANAIGEPNNSQLVNLTVLSLTTQPIALIIAPEAPTYTRIRYQTFIADRLVPVPPVGCWAAWVPGADLYFEGNNRTWSAGSSNNKTAFDFHINWVTGKIDTISRSVGKTQVVRVFPLTNSEYLGESATASSSSMVVSLSGSQSATQKTFQMRQDISNPFCASLGIYYDLLISVRQSGSYSVSGELRKVPNHELYIRDSNSLTWTTVYRYTNVGFYCLTPGAACVDIVDKTGTVQ